MLIYEKPHYLKDSAGQIIQECEALNILFGPNDPVPDFDEIEMPDVLVYEEETGLDSEGQPIFAHHILVDGVEK